MIITTTEKPRSGIDYDAFMAMRDDGRRFAYDDRDTMLYALGSGMGRDPLDEKELPFVYEGEGFVAMPTLAVVVARSPMPRNLPIDYSMLLHGEQSLTIHRPLPTACELIADTHITRILDKGADRGALIYHETTARDAADDTRLFTLGGTLFARGDGGFGGSSEGAPPPPRIPTRDPDIVFVSDTRPDQALLYRLSGDRNPLHADPAAARRAGFPKPILHGLGTYGIACRALLATVCDYDPARMESFDVRFTSPVFPGDRIETDIWLEGNSALFQCRVPARGIAALNGCSSLV